MITITQDISIKANVNVIWSYLSDFSNSLNFNRFHSNVKIPANYSLGKKETFVINHNFGFGNYKMIAEVKDCVPPHRLSISEHCIEDPTKGFPHTIVFQISEGLQKSKHSNATNYWESSTVPGK